MERTVGKTVEKTREKTREKIIRLITENSDITTSQLADKIGLTVKGIEYHIAKLKTEKIIDRIGPDKSGKWIVLERRKP